MIRSTQILLTNSLLKKRQVAFLFFLFSYHIQFSYHILGYIISKKYILVYNTFVNLSHIFLELINPFTKVTV